MTILIRHASADTFIDPSRISARFSPAADATARLWWDARPAKLRGTDDGTWWRDRIGGAIARQRTAASKPVWGETALGAAPAFTFDGSNDFFDVEGGVPAGVPTGAAAGWAAALVLQAQAADSSADNRAVFGYGSGASSRSINRRDPTAAANRLYLPTEATDGTLTGTVATFSGVCAVFAAWSGSGLISGTVNGEAEPSQQATTAIATLATRMRIGANANTGSTSYWSGAIAQLVIGTGEPSVATRQRHEGFLAWAGGIAASLVAGHPYRDVRP